jgi:hypothetical protein
MGVTHFHVIDGKIVDEWVLYDEFSMLVQNRMAELQKDLRAQVVDHASKHPAASVHNRPRRKIVRIQRKRTGLHDVAQPVEHLARIMRALAGILALQQQVWRNQRSFRQMLIQ